MHQIPPRKRRSAPLTSRDAGKFRLLALAGQGGMGAVWKAEDTMLGRTVALKFLPDALAASPEARRRFVREGRTAGGLSHPGIAMVHEIGELDQKLYIAMQWIDGETITDLAARGALAVPEAVRIARDAADALAYAHGHGVLHRDISGRNVMVTHDGHVMILDFGLALPEGTSRITSGNGAIGTIAYLAPEVILGAPASELSDQYSLGVVLYEMLTGTLPFRSERAGAMLYAAVNEALEPPRARRADLPAEVEAVVLTAMARDPRRRFKSVDALAEALRRIDQGDLRRLPMPQPGRSKPRPKRRHAPDPEPAPRYVVVLPFQDLHADGQADTQREYFALGITETVSAQLSRYPGILVVSPPAGGAAPGVPHDLREVARDAGADVVLRGTIQGAGNRLRLTFSLVDPLEGIQIAGDVLDGSMSEVFSLQDMLARRVAGALRPGAVSVTALTDRTGMEAISAQQHFLQALGYLQRFDSEAQVDGAIGLLEALRDGGNDSALVEAALGRAHLFKYEITHDTRCTEAARVACRRALEMDPRSPDVHMTLGNIHRVSGRLAEAVRSFTRALRHNPDHPDALAGLARTLRAAGRNAEAEECYLKAMALRPDFWEPYHLLAGFYFAQARYEEAATLWQKVVALTPDNARAFLNLGGAYFRLERFDDAMAAFNRSIEIRPEPSAYSNLGTLHYFLGHHEAAAEMFERAVALRPALPRLWGNLGDAYRWLPGRRAEADAAFERAITLMQGELEVNPRDAEGLGWMAEWMARRGDLERATKTIRRALRIAPRMLESMVRAVNVFHQAGQRAETLKWLEAALRAGYGLTEFERDPDLSELRRDPEYARLTSSIIAAPSGAARVLAEPSESGRKPGFGEPV